MNSSNNIPLFPLNTVLFPGGLLPLRIFEARYLDMLGECMREQSGFGICAISSGAEVGDAADVYPVGTLATITDFDRGEDGLLLVVVKGEKRFRIIDSEVAPNRLRRADVQWLDDTAAAELPASKRSLADLLASLLNQAGKPFTEMDSAYNDAGWVTGRLAELLPFALEDKQRLLAMDDPLERLRVLYDELLAEELGKR